MGICVKKIAGKTKRDRLKDEELRQMVNQEAIPNKIERRQLGWFGHLIRMDSRRITKRI